MLLQKLYSKLKHSKIYNTLWLFFHKIPEEVARKDDKGNVLYIRDSIGTEINYVRDSLGNILKHSNSSGEWYEFTRDSAGRELTYKDSNGNQHEYTRDSHGHVLTYKDSDGDWYNFTRDTEGRILEFINRNDHHIKFTRAENGNLLSCTTNGETVIYIAADEHYGLHFDRSLYLAGCRIFTRDNAIKHWTNRAGNTDPIIQARAIKFLKAIEEHQKSLTIR